MAASASPSLLLLLLALLASAASLPPAAPPHQCPVKSCQKGTPASLLQSSVAKSAPPPPSGDSANEALKSEKPCEEVSSYDVEFIPGHFTCSKCDATSCPDCSVLCDLSSCVGEFYTTECWCDTGSGMSGPAGEPTTAFCDEHCSGGVCSSDGYACRTRQTACEPWWWCGAPPPTSFLQLASSDSAREEGSKRLLGGRAKEKEGVATKRRQLQARLRSALLDASSASRKRLQRSLSLSKTSSALPPELDSLKFQDGRFVCESGALPPKTKNPETFMWVERGYLVLDRRSCQGSLFTHTCFCWDAVKYQKGLDPLTSEFRCDQTCGWGVCEGRTCGKKPPSPLPRSFVSPRGHLPGQLRADTTMDVVMESVDDLVDSKADVGNGPEAML